MYFKSTYKYFLCFLFLMTGALGAAEQVIKNHGSYLSREWKDLDAGELVLEEGDHTLELRAVKMPGVKMPDIKAVFFDRL